MALSLRDPVLDERAATRARMHSEAMAAKALVSEGSEGSS
jgi:hypothetical protein